MKLKTLAIVVGILAVLSLAAYCLQRPPAPAGKDPRTDQPVFDMKALEMAAKDIPLRSGQVGGPGPAA